jgi:hypothetical protein
LVYFLNKSFKGLLSGSLWNISSSFEIPATVAALYILRESSFYVSHDFRVLPLSQARNYLNNLAFEVRVLANSNSSAIFPWDDYIHRNYSLSLFNWFQFVKHFKKIPIPSKFVPGIHFHFKTSHPQAKSHLMEKQQNPSLVHIKSSRLPDISNVLFEPTEEQIDLYSQSLLLLFKPFTNMNELKCKDQTWKEAYQQINSSDLKIFEIHNQDYWISTRNQDSFHEKLHYVSEASNQKIPDAEGVWEFPTQDDIIECSIQNSIESFFEVTDTILNVGKVIEATTSGFDIPLGNEKSQNRITTETKGSTSAFPDNETCLRYIDEYFHLRPNRNQNESRFCPYPAEVAARYNLNHLQTDAFLSAANTLLRYYTLMIKGEVTNSLDASETKKLYMFLSGQGGTGKSRVIESITFFADAWGFPKSVMTIAFTGIFIYRHFRYCC